MKIGKSKNFKYKGYDVVLSYKWADTFDKNTGLPDGGMRPTMQLVVATDRYLVSFIFDKATMIYFLSKQCIFKLKQTEGKYGENKQ